MPFEELFKRGQLKKEDSSKEQIAGFLQFAEDEIAAAKFNLSPFPLTAFKSAYDALLHAGNALIRFYGFRPTSQYTHATITECVEEILGREYSHLVKKFKLMRRKRHPLLYEAKFIESEKEVEEAIQKAEELIKRIEEHVKVVPPQGRLF